METDETARALALTERFKATLNSDHRFRLSLMTGPLYDADKLFDLYRRTGIEQKIFPVTPLKEAQADSTVLQPASEMQYAPAEPLDHYVFRNPNFRRKPLRVYRFRDVYLSYDTRNHGRPQYYFFTKGGKLINGMFFGGTPFLEEPHAEVEGTSVFVDDFHTTFNICHLLYDKFPKAYLAQTRFGAETAIFLCRAEFIETLCTISGMKAYMPPEKRRRRGTVLLQDCIVFEHNFFTLAHPARFGDPLSLEALAALRDRVASSGPGSVDAPERYLVVRQPGGPRAAVNSEAVTAIFEQHGFVPGDPGMLPPLNQMQLFLNVSRLAGIHGAGLAHLAFLRPGGTVVELMPPLCATNAYWVMSRALKLRYAHLVCEDPEMGAIDALNRRHDATHIRRDVRVPEQALKDLLARLED